MKLGKQGNVGESGTVLLGTLIAAMVVGMVLIGYMTMVSSAHRDVVRSEAWNTSMALAEAGVEEALAHLAVNFPSNLVSQGWFQDGTNIVRTRTLGQEYYTVRVSLAPMPVVTSHGYTKYAGDNSYLSRSVQVITMQTSVVSKVFATKLDIKMNGNNISSDSYDSSNPLYSDVDGRYDPAKARDNGDIATNLGTDWAFDAGNANIMGRVSTGPDGEVSFNANATIGSETWHLNNSTGIEPGWSADDANVPMPVVELPDMSGSFTPTSGIVDGTNYTYVMASGKYELPRLAGNILITGDVTLHVTTQINIGNTDVLRIAPGASLKIYMSGDRAQINGQAVANDTGLPENLIYYGLPSNSNLSMGGGAEFAGVIYAPYTDLQLNGGGNIYGAIISKSAQINGHYGFHFDESLDRTFEFKRIAVLSWEEI